MHFKFYSLMNLYVRYTVLTFCAAISFVDSFAQNNVDSQREKKDTLRAAFIEAKSKDAPSLSSTPVQIISKNTFDNLGIQELSDAVKTFSGVQIKDYGGIGGIKTVSIRSMGSQHTAVSYDGVTISNAQNGQIDIGRFNLDNISQVSLLVGPSNDIFQSARMFSSAGSLNIKTLKPHFDSVALHVFATMKYGSFSTWNPSMIIESRLSPKWSLSANADWLKSDGVYPFSLVNGTIVTKEKRYNSDVNTLRSELNLFGDMGRMGKISMKGNYYNSERGLPGSVILYNKDANERLWDVNGFGQICYENSIGSKLDIKGQFKYSYSWNKYRDEKEYYPGGRLTDYYTQQECYGSIAALYSPFRRFSFSLAQDFFTNKMESSINNFVYPFRKTSLTALAGKYSDDRLTVTASALGTYITENVEVGEAAPDRGRISPAVSVSYSIIKENVLRLRASYQDIFRTPTFNDLYYAKIGNKNLKPEIARQFNFGIVLNKTFSTGRLEYLSFSADAYYNKVKDKIVALPTLFIWKMMNMGEVKIIGSDINLGFTISLLTGLRFEFAGNYTFQYAVDITDKESKNYKDQIPYTPRHSGNISATLLNKWVNVGYMMSAVGERFALPQNIQSNLIEGYLEHTLSFNRLFRAGRFGLRLQFDCQNITDKQYEVIQYYPMPGRSYKFSVKFIY